MISTRESTTKKDCLPAAWPGDGYPRQPRNNAGEFRWLELLPFDLSFGPLHSDPRFADLVRRIGLDSAKVVSQRATK